MVETSDHQAFQLHPTHGSPPQGPVVNIEVCTDVSTGEKFIFWEDIETFFPRLQSIRRDNIMITFMRDNHGHRYNPVRIKHYPGVTLSVTVSNNNTTIRDDDSTSNSQPPSYISTLPDFSAPTAAAVTGHTPRAPQLWEIDTPTHQMEELLPTRNVSTGRSGPHILLTSSTSTDIPPLFIVLPDPLRERPSERKFRLFFLCEGGSQTQFRRLCNNTDEVVPGHPHVCGHEGYQLERLDDFSRQYGSYALNVLESIKYGYPLRDQVISSPKDIEPLRILREGRDGIEYHRMNCGDIAAGVDEDIKYLRPGRTSSREAFKRRAAAGGMRSMTTEDLSGVRLFLKDVREFETISPDGSGGLGYLTKGATPTGQTTWLCYTLHQAIYDTNALVMVKRAIAGSFDYDEGILKLITFSGPHTGATLTGLLRALSSTSLVTELDLELDQELTYKNLKQLKDTIFGMKRLRRLNLNLANRGGPISDIFNLGKRGDALAEILTSGTLQAVSFRQVEWFFTKSSTFAALERINLSEIHLEANFEPKTHTQKLKNLLHRCSKLEVLELWCSDGHFGDTIDIVKSIFQGQDTFRFLYLNSPHFKAAFDRVYIDPQVSALPPRIKFPANSSRSAEMRVLHRFGSLIHTFAIDDTTTDEEIVILRDCIQQQGSKLGRVDIVISPSTSRLTNIDVLQSAILTINNPAAANRTGSPDKQLDRSAGTSTNSGVACSVAFKSSDILTDKRAHFVGAVFPCLISLELEMSDSSTPYPYGIGQELSALKTYTSRGTERVLSSPKAQELTQIVSQSPLLTSLSLRYTHLDSKDWEVVLETLDYRRLELLNLNFTNFSDVQAIILVDRLEESSSLPVLGEIRIQFVPMGRVARHAFKKRMELILPNCRVNMQS
ncbi:hypothetical protein KI688_010685 [Linnemannia hyalina]|uniref:Uncharacterized protein n=1 Tax=Linnemannia hyalina TaxID=64524 RepID=A0A9P7XWJ0_9FUNG|nr:hypothetical protein KI688_010685 [Linnemannia hyalina]